MTRSNQEGAVEPGRPLPDRGVSGPASDGHHAPDLDDRPFPDLGSRALPDDADPAPAEPDFQHGYRSLLRLPHAWAIVWYGLLGRFPLAMAPLTLVLVGQQVADSFAIGGLAAGGYSLARALSSPWLGRLTDQHGQRLVGRAQLVGFVLVLAALIGVAARLVPVVALVPLAILAGVATPNISAFSRSRWLDMVPESGVGRSQAIESLNDEITFLIGPAAVALAGTVLPVWVPLAVIGVACVVGTWGLTAVPAHVEPGSAHAAPHADQPRGRWLSVGWAIFLGVPTTMGMALSGVTLVVVASTQAWGQEGSASVVYIVNALASMVGAAVVGHLAMTHPTLRLAAVSGLYLAGLLPLAFVSNVPGLIVAGLTCGLFLAPLLIVVNTVVAVLTPAENRAEAFSWVGAALGLGLAIGSTVVGYALDASGELAGRQLTVLLALGPVLFSLLWAWHYAATGRRTAGR